MRKPVIPTAVADGAQNLPAGAAEIARAHPDVWRAYQQLGEACAEAGPLDAKTLRLVKLAIAVGAESEGAVHSHTRRALRAGLSQEELLHVAVLAIPSLGLAKAVKARTWIEDIARSDDHRA
jgi:alkylhydroperoxidase/carboxymuconolactone decarboxylase family protein YurZ